jgi:hypothetical protein
LKRHEWRIIGKAYINYSRLTWLLTKVVTDSAETLANDLLL